MQNKEEYNDFYYFIRLAISSFYTKCLDNNYNSFYSSLLDKGYSMEDYQDFLEVIYRDFMEGNK